MVRSSKSAAPSIAVLLGAAAICVSGSVLSAQRVAHTSEGHPDLQGMWLNDTATPLERPKEFVGRTSVSDEEARAYEQRYQLDRTAALSRVDPAFELQAAGDLDTYEPGHLLPGNRTSLITDPPDGRLPALTPAAQRRATEQAEHLKAHWGENPEDFPNPERCLQVGQASAPPMLPVFYNNNVQIVQTRDYVILVSEMIHDVRIVPIDGRQHLPSGIGQWKGDSIGHWDGDTLVLDTTNFTDKTNVRGSGTGLHIVERLSLSDANTLKYQFTIDDPASFVRSWSGESAMTRSTGQMYEYACHEGNQSLPIMMRGLRFSEQEAGMPKPQSTPKK
jgi:hypothetical protein